MEDLENASFSPVIFNIFGLDIRWYSVFILLGIGISYFLIFRESKKFKYDLEFISNLLFWTIILGITGARIYYVIFKLNEYNSFLDALKIWKGGLAIHGGIIAGLITIIFYTKKHKVRTLKILDIMAPALIISQAIGRWGNFFNREAYGSKVTDQILLKIKIIPSFIIKNMYINGEYKLPMFYFESLLCLLGFLLLLFIRRRKYIKIGQIFSTYLIWYGFIRFFIEWFRDDSLMLFKTIKMAQIVSVLMIFVGIFIIIIQSKKPKLEDLYNSTNDNYK